MNSTRFAGPLCESGGSPDNLPLQPDERLRGPRGSLLMPRRCGPCPHLLAGRATLAATVRRSPLNGDIVGQTKAMLKRDKEAFLRLVSGDVALEESAVTELNSRPRGHFEDHPMSAALVRQNLIELSSLWNRNSVTGCRPWVLQFVADAGVVDVSTRPMVLAALADHDCAFLPTVLYLIGTAPERFPDIGPYLRKLAEHHDREVRWRVAYVASRMPSIDEPTHEALHLLSAEDDQTIQLYVRECEKKPRPAET